MARSLLSLVALTAVAFVGQQNGAEALTIPSSNASPVVVPKVRLNNGLEMPILGLGTYLSLENEAYNATKLAIDAGYRHFDTAYLYENEEEVGRALKEKIADGAVKREDLFVVTKLWNSDHQNVEAACRRSVANLGLGFIDLYLIHWPTAFKTHDPFTWFPLRPDGLYDTIDIDYVETWKAMERLVDLGLVRSIGLSNFNSVQVDRVLANSRIKPVVNQVEASPQINQRKLIKFCKERDIVVAAFSPLGRPNPAEQKPAFMFDAKMSAIAKKHNKSVPQVVFRYLIESGAVPIPKSTRKHRIEENINVFDFALTAEETQIIDGFNTGERILPYDEGRSSKYFPFDIEY